MQINKIRLFCDWTDSKILHEAVLKDYRIGLKIKDDNIYKNIQFVNDESFQYAIFINGYIESGINLTKKEKIVISMEPPEFIGDINSVNIDRLFIPFKDSFNYYYAENKIPASTIGVGFHWPLFWTLHAEPWNSDVPPSNKPFQMSAIQSNKGITSEQVIRSKIFHMLKEGSRFQYSEFFGEASGKKRLEKKENGLRPFQHSCAFENSIFEGVLTEKFYDCIVSNTIPITNNKTAFNCPYFSEDAFKYIDLHQKEELVLNQIFDIIQTPISSKQDKALLDAKKEILFGENNFVHQLYRIIKLITF